MYPTLQDTQRCISNNKVIIQQAVVEWKMQITKYLQFLNEGPLRPENVDNFSDTKALGGKAPQQTYPNWEVGISNIYSLVLYYLHIY